MAVRNAYDNRVTHSQKSPQLKTPRSSPEPNPFGLWAQEDYGHVKDLVNASGGGGGAK